MFSSVLQKSSSSAGCQTVLCLCYYSPLSTFHYIAFLRALQYAVVMVFFVFCCTQVLGLVVDLISGSISVIADGEFVGHAFGAFSASFDDEVTHRSQAKPLTISPL
jgi:hypothetical protein